MTWNDLLAVLEAAGLTEPSGGTAQVDDRTTITGLAYDSRLVQPGDVFVALKGQKADGAAFIEHAVARGASAVVSEPPMATPAGIPSVGVRDARLALAHLAAAFYRYPSKELLIVGITGTNGKTTTAHLVASIFDAAQIKCGIVGTVGYLVGDEVREAVHTTPEAPDAQRMLREMVDRGCGACAMEVSSHALSLRRVDATAFAAAVFTNLTRDHLDFHSDMEEYFQAKRRLFDMLPDGAPSLINLDDPRGLALAQMSSHPVTYAINRHADIAPGPLSSSLEGLRFDVRTPQGSVHLRSRLIGRANAYNILAAVATASALGLPLDAIERGVAALAGVPGRFQLVSVPGDEVTVVVDFAHTDDALRHLLETARPLASGRLVTVFGCGGDRDRTKRPLMGAVASRLSDLIVITSDNPRSEDAERIIEEIQRGITADTRRDDSQRVVTLADRRAAIHRAVELARPGDFVLIAGKGHERYQIVGNQTLPFDDVAVAREALERRRTNSGVV